MYTHLTVEQRQLALRLKARPGHGGRIKDMVMISERPAEADDRHDNPPKGTYLCPRSAG